MTKTHPFTRFEPTLVTEWLDGERVLFQWDAYQKTLIFAEKANVGTAREAVKQNPWLGDFCKTNPKVVVHAVAYGDVGRYRYGAVKEQVKLAVYDLGLDNKILAPREARTLGHNLFWVPTIATGHFVEEWLAFAHGKTYVPGADNPRKGVVIRPQVPRNDESGKPVIFYCKNDTTLPVVVA